MKRKDDIEEDLEDYIEKISEPITLETIKDYINEDDYISLNDEYIKKMNIKFMSFKTLIGHKNDDDDDIKVILKSNSGLNKYEGEIKDEGNDKKYHIYNDPLFKWRYELSLKELKDEEFELYFNYLFEKWFNKLHYYHKKNKVLRKLNVKKPYNFYSILCPSYIEIYRDYFYNYMVDEVPTYGNSIYDINNDERKFLYKKYIQLKNEQIMPNFNKLMDKYNNISNKLNEEYNLLDIERLKKAKVVCMTIYGGGKYIDLLKDLKSEIVIVEEANRILECYLSSIFGDNIKHLIMIGDHKLLNPYSLNINFSNEYNFSVSLYERLINNGLEYVKLNTQRRMRPEISGIIKSMNLYPDISIIDESEKYEKIKGIKVPLYFFNHKFHDNTYEEVIEGMIRKVCINEKESLMICYFVKYLLQQEYNPEKITILCLYPSQCKQISYNLFSVIDNEDICKKILVKSVASFQSDENDIVIVSTVKSNDKNEIGIVAKENLVNVGLSRAKKGLYIFGNMKCLIEGTKYSEFTKNPYKNIWENISKYLEENRFIGKALPLHCETHNKNVLIKDPEDFKKYCPEGGCSEICNKNKSCGHKCERKCHKGECEINVCDKPCLLKLKCGHKCKNKCFEECTTKCNEEITITLRCGHNKKVNCYFKDKYNDNYECQAPCPKTLDCGHKCKNKCYEKCTSKCEEEINIEQDCKHTITVQCYEADEYKDGKKCKSKCNVKLPCVHNCPGICGECRSNNKHQQCDKNCNIKLPCGHNCNNKCGEPCQEICNKKIRIKMNCGHNQNFKCCEADENKDGKQCNNICGKELLCGHQCSGKCRDCLGGLLHVKCNEKCGKTLSCGHNCMKKCGESCFPCNNRKELVKKISVSKLNEIENVIHNNLEKDINDNELHRIRNNIINKKNDYYSKELNEKDYQEYFQDYCFSCCYVDLINIENV